MINPLSIKKNLQSGLGQSLYYKQPFLQPNDSNSSSFLREISYKVNLTGKNTNYLRINLRSVSGSEHMLFQLKHGILSYLTQNHKQNIIKGVQLRISTLGVEPRWKTSLLAGSSQQRYLFRSNQPCVDIVKLWKISNEFLLYKPQIDDENYDYYHVTNLKNGNSTLLIKDPLNDPAFNLLAYNDKTLYVASSQTIYLFPCNYDMRPGDKLKVEVDFLTLSKITPGLPIHGLFHIKQKVSMFFWKSFVCCAMETDDNQIDFSQILPTDIGTPAFNYTLKQQRELVTRDVKMDQIQKLTFMVDSSNIFYGIALRKSGRFDLYWNMTLVDSPPEGKCVDCFCSFEHLYLKMADNTVKSVSTSAGPSLSFEQSHTEDPEYEFHNIFFQNIINHGIFYYHLIIPLVNLYKSFTLIRTTLYIAHGQYVSLFNIQENQWLRHCKFEEGLITCMIKKQAISQKENKPKLELAVLFENGAIYNNVQKLFFNFAFIDQLNINKAMSIGLQHKSFNLQGDLVRTAMDQQRNEWFYILTRDKNTEVNTMYTLHHDNLYKINIGVVSEIDGNSNFLPLNIFLEFTNFAHVFCPGQQQYIMFQKYTHCNLYKIFIGQPPLDEEEKDSPLKQLVEDDVILEHVLKIELPIQENVHSCISLDIKDHIFLLDHHHFYRYQMVTKTHTIYANQNVVSIYVVDEKFCYTLSQATADRNSGLMLYDINNILKKDNDVSYRLSNVQTGFSGLLDFNQDYSRFSLLKSFDTLVIIPALHRNTIAFIGMSRREQYLATKVIKDKFIALDKNNYIFCWSIVTGKLLSVHKLPNRQDFSNFKIFRSEEEPEDSCPYYRNYYNKILLVKEKAEENFDETSFYKEDGQLSNIKNQQLFAQTQKREFREFRLVEIISEGEIKEHLVFIHPYYMNEPQRIYFDSSHKFMLEKLSHPRVFLYEREESRLRSKQVRWRCLRRWNKYPEELENESGHLRVLSPSFQYHLDFDKAAKEYVIRDTFALRDIYRVPKHLMNGEQESPATIMNRFKWVSDEIVQLISREGMESIIDVKDKFKEIEYNMIPCFDQDEIKQPLRSFYYNRPPLQIAHVKERLIRKYQQYKTAYYLEHKREPFSLYDSLFTVDYQVDKCKGMFVADMSFTFLHWQIMEQIQKGNLHIDSIDDQQIELLSYNILPGGNTVLHQLNQNSGAIMKIFDLAHPNEEDVHEMAFHIPFIQNLEGKSPMHICKEHQDVRAMDTMVSYLTAYGLDHHSRAISDIIPFLVEKQIPALLSYLDSRLQPSYGLWATTTTNLQLEQQNDPNSQVAIGQQSDKRGPGEETQIEKPTKVEIVDLPSIYHYSNENFNKLFSSLAHTTQYEIFEKKSIQKLVEFNYPLVKEWTRRKLQMPFVINQVVLFCYLSFVFGQDPEKVSKLVILLDLPCQIVLGGFSLYFLYFNGYLQVKHDGVAFLGSIWSYINIITPCTILSVLSINALSIPIGEENERILQAIGVFFMWYKFLYFFRLSKSMGYLTRLIIIVIMDMSTFLVVLFFTIVAFSDTFLTISNGNDGVIQDGVLQEPFVKGFFDAILYVYLIVLGSFNMEHFSNSIATNLLITFFIVCTVFNTIVMLNLLIAIIGETFSIVKANAENAQFQEMAALISENSYLIPESVKKEYAGKQTYLMVQTELDAEMDQSDDAIIAKLELIRSQTIHKIVKISKGLKDIKKDTKKEEKESEKQEQFFLKVIAMMQTIPGIQNEIEKELNSSRLMGRVGRHTMWAANSNALNQSFSMKSIAELQKRMTLQK